MSDHSLMNPDFLKKEIADCTELLTDSEKFMQELDLDINRLTNHLINARRHATSTEVALSHDETREIAEFLGKISVYKYRMTSGRQVAISQYKQLLKDRRYRIATKLLNLFK
jgi:hypothetical protein